MPRPEYQAFGRRHLLRAGARLARKYDETLMPAAVQRGIDTPQTVVGGALSDMICAVKGH
jgi:hypothetical protein